MDPVRNKNRVSLKIKCPNPLFEKWLTEWRDKAVANDSKMQYTFNNALHCLRRYPLPLNSGRDCKILKGFGGKICKMLDDKLLKYSNEENYKTKNINMSNAVIDQPFKEYIPQFRSEGEKKNTKNISPQMSKSIDQSFREYIPQQGTGGYAILLAIYKESLKSDYPGFLRKADIILHGQQFVNSSFTKANPGSHYTAWSSMKTLISKKLILKISHPPKYSLSEEGTLLAKRLYEKGYFKCSKPKYLDDNLKEIEVDNAVQDNTSEVIQLSKLCDSRNPLKKDASKYKINKKNTNSYSGMQEFVLTSERFNIILYVDNNETSGKINDEAIIFLKKYNIKYEIKNLKVGDFLWVCRDYETENELVLPFIIERKRMDDFASSIKDKRYHEQKFRLKRSGIENLIYLVESYGKNQHLGLPLQTLYQAASYTALQEHFFIKFTGSLNESIEYLAYFTRTLIQIYKRKTLKSCGKDSLIDVDINQDVLYLMPFKQFNENAVKNKNMKVSEYFIKSLIQIKGMSVERALAITEKYSSPALLRKAYKSMTTMEGEKLLSSIKYDRGGKTIGIALSKTVYQIFNLRNY
ncbi:crossover junction endonuclease MUS81 [Sitophilus oryzae]|uniref:Crossover junction endonuclease MUS81 n=1 Tax=Sitophilus oryzae TaxID=7048 RepID=A0A6J2YTQ9_SITOR|nr:crossover junction endonuclease MUS81 [Sitophilus oryzae]XP_030767483.1 crossover junction endonuclease MUS81 [Sitophilus oryzae]